MVAAAAEVVFVVAAALVVAGASVMASLVVAALVVAGFSVEAALVVAGSSVVAGSADDDANVGTSPPALATAVVAAASADEEDELAFALQRRSFARFDLRGTTVAGICGTGAASSAIARATTACPRRWLSLLARWGVIMAEADIAMPRRRKARVKCIVVCGGGVEVR